MQYLVLSALPDDVPSLGPDFWDMAWRDLAELVERGSLPCCSSFSFWRSIRRMKDLMSLNVHQGALTEQVPVCAPGRTHTGKAHTNSRTEPSWLRSFLLRCLGFSWQETKPAQTKNQGGKAASRTVGDPTEDRFTSWPPPAEECILRENILLPDGRLPQRPDNLVPPPERAVNPPALRSSFRNSAGVATRRPASTRRDVGVETSDREENSQCCEYCAQRRTEMGSGKERGRADELHAGTSSYTVPPHLGTVTRENIMSIDAAVRWWEQKTQVAVGLSMHPQEVPKKHRTVRPPPMVAAPSRLAAQDDCRSAASQRLNSALGGRRAREQPPQICSCMHPPGEERLHQPNQVQCWCDNNKAQRSSEMSVPSQMFWEGSVTVRARRNSEEAVWHSMIKVRHRHVQ
ncbi:uncharacterized protein LOC116241411 [Phasianus colchicus]|uniref:uncharacterized protein LOC116241411 n=1 Tax=Phasianus colchicus TaxID=9054 RepID=UPI00129DB8FC|nr:uncharacterized protein LOC116241411 [Phasianus colchicus]